MKTAQHCHICWGAGRIDGVICATCGGSGVVTVDHRPIGDPRGGRGGGVNWGAPVTGILRSFGYVMLGGIAWATYLSYQNAPGEPGDKVFTATITFGVLGLTAIVVLRLLAAGRTVILAVIVLGGIDFFANEGKVLAATLEVAGPALASFEKAVRALVLGPS